MLDTVYCKLSVHLHCRQLTLDTNASSSLSEWKEKLHVPKIPSLLLLTHCFATSTSIAFEMLWPGRSLLCTTKPKYSSKCWRERCSQLPTLKINTRYHRHTTSLPTWWFWMATFNSTCILSKSALDILEQSAWLGVVELGRWLIVLFQSMCDLNVHSPCKQHNFPSKQTRQLISRSPAKLGVTPTKIRQQPSKSPKRHLNYFRACLRVLVSVYCVFRCEKLE